MSKGVALAAVFLFAVSFLQSIGSNGTEHTFISPSSPTSSSTVPQTDFSDYIWPTDAGSVITSTFAEYRRTHFHGGIDISTGNDTGFRVFASRDGYVSRILTSPTGYGKMLYVRHNDGYSTTYAHLRNFSPTIDARVREEQAKNGSYPVDIRCGPLEYPVRKGEVIAFTGETGVGTPHLHFEIRDPLNNFVNPLQCTAFPNTDTVLPTVQKVAVRPIGKSGMVDGSWKVATYRLRENARGSYELRSSIHISGSAGFAIDIRDRSEETYYRQGIHSHVFFVDGVPFYSVELDRAPAGNSHQSGLYYDWDLSDAGLGRFHRLYATLPNDLWFYTPREDSSGVINLSRFTPGPHSFRIVSTDRGGNSTTVSGEFVLHSLPAVSIRKENDFFKVSFEPSSGIKYAHLSTRESKSATWSTLTKPLAEFGNPLEVDSRGIDILKVVAEDLWGAKSPPSVYRLAPVKGKPASVTLTHEVGYSFIRIHIRTEGALAEGPILRLSEGNLQRELPVSPVDVDHFTATFVPNDTIGGIRRAVAHVTTGKTTISAFDEFEIYPLRAGSFGTYLIDKGNFVLSYDPESVLNTTFVEVTRGSFADGVSYNLEPANTVLNRGIVVGMKHAPGQEKAALFAHGRRGWDLLARQEEMMNGMLTGRMTQTLGEVTIVVDNTPPSISRVNIRQSRQAYPVISFRFDDGFSGIEYHELKMYIDEKIVIPEVDGEHKRAVYQTIEPLKKGKHLLTIRIKDRLDNQREFTKQFTVR